MMAHIFNPSFGEAALWVQSQSGLQVKLQASMAAVGPFIKNKIKRNKQSIKQANNKI